MVALRGLCVFAVCTTAAPAAPLLANGGGPNCASFVQVVSQRDRRWLTDDAGVPERAKAPRAPTDPWDASTAAQPKQMLPGSRSQVVLLETPKDRGGQQMAKFGSTAREAPPASRGPWNRSIAVQPKQMLPGSQSQVVLLETPKDRGGQQMAEDKAPMLTHTLDLLGLRREGSAGVWLLGAYILLVGSMAVAYFCYVSVSSEPSPRPLGNKEPQTKPLRSPAPSQEPLGVEDAGRRSGVVEARLRTTDSAMRPNSSNPKAAGAVAVAQFCPELMVPPNCECTLVIPVGPEMEFNITDVSGSVVLRVSTNMLSGGGGPGSLTLTTADSRTVALVRPAGSTTPVTEFHLLRTSGELFGRLTCLEEGRYQLTTHGGSPPMNFWGSFVDHAVNVTDEGRGLLATTELSHVEFDPAGEYYRLRVAPLTDVGLILCSLLAVDRLGGKGRR